jgi:hypothetical protein
VLRLCAGRLGLSRREDLDLAGLQLGTDRRDLVFLELVLVRERLEDALLDRAPLLRLFEDGMDRCVKANGAQCPSLSFASSTSPEDNKSRTPSRR